MFKKSLQVVATFGLLLAAYAGYDRVFALVAARIQATQVLPVTKLAQRQSRTLEEAIGRTSRSGTRRSIASAGVKAPKLF